MPITRRRSERTTETDEKPDRPTRSRPSDDMPDEERNGQPRRRRGERREGHGARGWGSFEQKRAKASTYADDFKPGADNKTLIKFMEEEPFDSYNQHWIEARDLPSGVKRNSYMCRDDEYFGETADDRACPLCEIGEAARTYSLFNVLDLTNPRKPEIKVWTAPPTVSSILKRAAGEKKTSPINRDDLYWEVELVKSKNKSEWRLVPVKARDLEDDYEMTALDEEELESFKDDLFTDRKDVTKVDSYEDLDSLAEALED